MQGTNVKIIEDLNITFNFYNFQKIKPFIQISSLKLHGD